MQFITLQQVQHLIKEVDRYAMHLEFGNDSGSYIYEVDCYAMHLVSGNGSGSDLCIYISIYSCVRVCTCFSSRSAYMQERPLNRSSDI